MLPASPGRRNHFSRQCNHAIYQKKHWTIRMDFRAVSRAIWPTLSKKLLRSLETEIYPQALTELKWKNLDYSSLSLREDEARAQRSRRTDNKSLGSSCSQGGPLMLLLPTHLTMLWVSIQNVFFNDSNSHRQSSIWPCG